MSYQSIMVINNNLKGCGRKWTQPTYLHLPEETEENNKKLQLRAGI